ncbi:MAG: replisome organizer [Oscillospiraceae bacterium]|nr:replisome organizer [Oscillospiraceae bacterium]
MAEKRMFSKEIISSDAFTDMPVTSRLLYFDLAMRADDDGFVNAPKQIMKIDGASTDDLLILVERGFIIPFKSGVIVIRHWKIHNYIRKDRYHPTAYQEEYHSLTLRNDKTYMELPEGERSDNQPLVDHLSTENRSTETSIDKIRVEESSSYTRIFQEILPEEVDALYERYEDAGNLIQEVHEQVKLKQKKIDNIYRYIVGYAIKKNWPRKDGGNNGSQI